jgi:voltage-gated potassium channel
MSSDVPKAGPQTRGAWAYRTLTRPVRETLKRYRVVRRLSAIFDLTLGPLALITLALLIAELLLQLSDPWSTIIYMAQIVIWVVFLLAFAIELSLAPKRLLYLRRNWLLVVALAVPALRVLRAAQALRFLQATRVVRGALLVRGIAAVNRAMIAIRGFLGFSQMAFLLTLTLLVWLASSALV